MSTETASSTRQRGNVGDVFFIASALVVFGAVALASRWLPIPLYFPGLVAVGGIISYRIVRKVSWRELGLTLDHWPRNLLIGLLIGGGIGGILYALWTYPFYIHTYPDLFGVSWNASLREFLPIIGLFTIVTVPTEELLFRGMLVGALQKLWHKWIAILMAAIVFSLLHLTGPYTANMTMVLNALLIGLVNGYLFVRLPPVSRIREIDLT